MVRSRCTWLTRGKPCNRPVDLEQCCGGEQAYYGHARLSAWNITSWQFDSMTKEEQDEFVDLRRSINKWFEEHPNP